MMKACFALSALVAANSCNTVETADVEAEVGQPAPGAGPRCNLGAPTPDGTPVMFPAQAMLGVIANLQLWAAGQQCAAGDPNQKNVRDVICNFTSALGAGNARATGVTTWGSTSTIVATKQTLEIYNGTTLVDRIVEQRAGLDPNANSDMNFYNCDYSCTNADPANPNAGAVLLSAAPFHSAVIKGNTGQDYLPPDGTGAAFCGQVQSEIKKAGLDCEIGAAPSVWKQTFKSLRDPKWVDTKKPGQSTTTCFPETNGFCPWFRTWKEAHPNQAVTSAVIISDGTIWERDAQAMLAKCQAEYAAVPAATRDDACAKSPDAPSSKPPLFAVEVGGNFVCTKAMQPGGGGIQMD